MTMATRLTDVLSLAPHQAAPSPRLIASRWSRLEPWVLMWIRRAPVADPADELHKMRLVHAERYTRLRIAGVTYPAIYKHRLDDPLACDDVFERKFADAVKHHRERLGRVKGIVKREMARASHVRITHIPATHPHPEANDPSADFPIPESHRITVDLRKRNSKGSQ